MQAQVETATGYILAHGQFPGGSPDPATIEVVTLTPEQQAVVVSDVPGQRVLGSDGTVTILPPPPLPPVYAQTYSAAVDTFRTTDAVATELWRMTVPLQTGFMVTAQVAGIDAGNGQMLRFEAKYSFKRLNAGALQVGTPQVVVDQRDAQAAAWVVAPALSGNDVLLRVTGAAGRSIDWSLTVDGRRFTPGGF